MSIFKNKTNNLQLHKQLNKIKNKTSPESTEHMHSFPVYLNLLCAFMRAIYEMTDTNELKWEMLAITDYPLGPFLKKDQKEPVQVGRKIIYDPIYVHLFEDRPTPMLGSHMESLFVKEEKADKIKQTSNSLDSTAKSWLSLAILTCYRESKFTAGDYRESLILNVVKTLADLGIKDNYLWEIGTENARSWSHDINFTRVVTAEDIESFMHWEKCVSQLNAEFTAMFHSHDQTFLND
uniref:Uncharacterized protein n=1 Tax=Glossina palpalis gambiensis TaxID=67801 RepID=A0A1B0B2U9_9MUSC